MSLLVLLTSITVLPLKNEPEPTDSNSAINSNTEIFKCVENGVTKFSAYPCTDPKAQQNYDVKTSESMSSYFERQQQKLQKKLVEQRERAQSYIDSYPAIPENIKNAILECKVVRGMSRKQVYFAWNVLPEKSRKDVSRESSLTYYTYKRSPICAVDKFKAAELTFDNRTKLLVGWNIQY